MSDRIKAVAIAEDKQHENFVLWVCDSYVQIVQQAAEMYMELHENVTLNVVGKTTDELREDFALKLAAGEPLPDVLLVDDDNLKEYITLQGELKQDMFRTWDDLIDPSIYVTSRVADVTVDDKMYGCPFTSTPVALYYNKHMLSETCGIDELPDDLTWDDFIDYGKRIKEQTGAFLLPSINNHITNILVRSTGSLFYNESGEIDPDNVAPILSLVEELTGAELVPNDNVDDINVWMRELMSERFFSVIGAPYWFTEIKKYVDEHNMDMEWDVVRLPKSDGLPYDVNYGGCSWMVMNNENTETSETVIDFLVQSFSQENTTSQEIVGMAAGQYDVVPPFERVWGVINSLDNNGCFHGRPVIKYLMEMSPDIPPFMIGYRFDQLSQRFYEIVHTIASGLTTAEDGLIDFSHYCLELPPFPGEELNYIVIEREPDKTDYFRNDSFSRDGMIVRAFFQDGTNRIVFGYSISPLVLLLNNDSVEVSYTSGHIRRTVTQRVTVRDRRVTDVVAEPAKNVYLHTNTLTTGDFSVCVKYDQGDDTYPRQYGISPTTLNRTGFQNVAISYYDVRSVDDTGTSYSGVTKHERTVTINVVRKLCSIEINDDHVSTTYSIGQTFCPDGLEVIARYSDGTSAKVTDLYWKDTPFTEINLMQEVRISYTENGVTVGGIIFVSVEDRVLESIRVSGAIRTRYIVGEVLDIEDMRVTAHYTNGSEQEVYNYFIDKADTLTKDDHEFTVQYKEGAVTASVRVSIEVVDKRLTALRISSPFGRLRCQKGTSASTSGMEVEVQYSGLVWERIENSRLSFSPSVCENVGTQNVTVNYTETYEADGETESVTVSGTVAVTVDGDYFENLHVVRQPSARRYYVGDSFSARGMVCAGTRGDGAQTELTDLIEYPGHDDSFQPGTDHVTVSCDYYGRHYETQVPVTVVERGVDNSIQGQTELTYDCDAGQAHVNLFHGRLAFEHLDACIGFNKTSISCSHVYNSMFEEETSLQYSRGDADYYRTGMGVGFKLSIQQYLFRDGYQDRYIYVDAAGYRHRFVKLHETKYYDTTGTDLVLTVAEGQSYIEDAPGNRLYFGNGVLVRATSCFENGQDQYFEYNEKGQLVTAYAQVNIAHKLLFVYNAAGMLVSLQCKNGATVEKELTFTYKELADHYYLTAIADADRTVRFGYEMGRLVHAADMETRSCLLFAYASGAVSKITLGTAVVADDTASVSIPDENIIKCNRFTTDRNRYIVTVQSGRVVSGETVDDVTVRYCMNARGFTTAVLEASGESLYSMEKLPGIRVRLTAQKKEGETTDGQNAAGQRVRKWDAGPENAINCTSVFCGSADDLYLFAENCKELTEYRKGKYASNVHFMLNFWVKLGRVPENPRLNIQIGSKKGWFSDEHTDFTQAVLDTSAIDVWQYVSIPVNITERNIKYLAIQPEDSCLNGIAIADVRLCPSARSGWYVCGANGAAPLDRVSTITYTLSDGTPCSSSVGKHCFMTDEDLRATFISMYRSRPAGGKLSTSSAFVLSLCSGTVKKWVTDATLVTSEWINGDWQERTCPLTMEVVAAAGTEPEHGIPSFYHETISPDDTLTVKSSMMFYPAMTIGDYTGDVIRAYTEATTGGKNGKRSETSLYSDFCGRTLREVDEYGVVTTYSYDAAGDLRKKSVSHPETEETLAYEVTNGSDSIVEKTSVSYQKTDYDGFWGDPVSTAYRGADESASDGTLQSIYTYDARRRLTSVANNLGDRNLLTYADGRLRTVSAADGASQSLYSYRVEYDRYGDPAQIFLRNSLSEAEQKLIQKETDRANGKIITKQYRDGEDTPDTVEIALDRYGRTACIRESSAGDGQCYQTDFRRQSLDESDGAAEVTYMYDPYEKRRYTYHYDDYNQCTGYSATSEVGDFSVRRTEADTVTYFEKTWDKRLSTVTHDDACLLSPRVTAANDLAGQTMKKGNRFLPNDIGQVRYRYDPLGRISGKTIQTTYSSETNLISVSREYLPGTTLKKNIEVSCPLTGGGNYGCSFRYEFDTRGRITKEISGSKTAGFTYDLADRLTGENTPTGGSKQYTYHADGSMASETLASGETIVYTYDRGRLVSRGGETYGYDAIGNCTSYRGTTLTWHRGSRLQKFGQDATYRYDNQGVRFEKVAGGVVTHFLRDGAKLVDELRDNIRIRYLYDAEEMIGFYCNGNYYYYVKDGLGNVRSVLRAEKILAADGDFYFAVSEVARYDYDAWGNCMATPVGDAGIFGVSVADFNPIRWRSQYYDRESGLYYIGGRYYSPVTKQFLSATNVEAVVANAAEIYGLNLYSLTVANPVNLGFGGYTIETNTPLAYDPPELNWWEKFWQSTAGKFVAVSLVVIAAVLCALTGQLGLFLMTAGSVAASLVIGASIAGYQSYACGRGFWRGFEQYIDGNWAQDAAIASIVLIVTVGVQAIAAAIRNAGSKRALANTVDNGFNEWLNAGDQDYVVYKAQREEDYVYTGITKQDLSKRLYQHNYHGKEFSKLTKVRTRLTRNQARSIETHLILHDGLSPENKILSISKRRRYFQQAMAWAKMFMKG